MAVANFEEFMARVHGIDLSGNKDEPFIAPTAAGAGGEGGGARDRRAVFGSFAWKWVGEMAS